MGELEPVVDAQVVDLNLTQARKITSRIRKWVNDFPRDEVVQAYFGRVWLPMGYGSWAEWCDCELGGFKLPTPQRREVVADLSGDGMSNRAIADVIGVAEGTIRNDHKSGAQNYAPAEVVGQDGRSYKRRVTDPAPSARDTILCDHGDHTFPTAFAVLKRTYKNVAYDLNLDQIEQIEAFLNRCLKALEKCKKELAK